MSAKSSKKTKTLSVPRTKEEIDKDFSQTATNAGKLQYQILVYQEELRQMNSRLLSLNQEGYARQQLDQQKDAQEVSNG